MNLVIQLLENQKQISETRLKGFHYPKEVEPVVKQKIEQISKAIKILEQSERQDPIEVSKQHKSKALNIADVVRSYSDIEKRITNLKSKKEQILKDYETAGEKEQELIANKFVQIELRIKELEWVVNS